MAAASSLPLVVLAVNSGSGLKQRSYLAAYWSWCGLSRCQPVFWRSNHRVIKWVLSWEGGWCKLRESDWSQLPSQGMPKRAEIFQRSGNLLLFLWITTPLFSIEINFTRLHCVSKSPLPALGPANTSTSETSTLKRSFPGAGRWYAGTKSEPCSLLEKWIGAVLQCGDWLI